MMVMMKFFFHSKTYVEGSISPVVNLIYLKVLTKPKRFAKNKVTHRDSKGYAGNDKKASYHKSTQSNTY